jgi:hypothetical protein
MFDTHKLNEEGFKQMSTFKSAFANAVEQALLLMPEGREKAIFKTKVEEAVFFGAKSIASKDGNFTEITTY